MEILFLISFIVFTAFGYYLGRKKKQIKSIVENCSHSYAQGLNYLLANESDKAIQLFVDLIKVDGETAETHLALGKLFRSKGEVDKAIKIHTNILAKPSLDILQRVQVLFELASDYLKAGLLDRAENVFKELLELDNKNIPALIHLQSMYIAEKSWLEAIYYSEQLIKLKYKDTQHILTHCYCELAETKGQSKEFHLSKKYLDIAIDFEPKCIRAHVLRLRISIEEGQLSQAEKTLIQLMKQNLSSIDLYIELIFNLFKNQNKLDHYAFFLQQHNSNYDNKTINLALLNFYFENSEFDNGKQLLDRIISLNADLDVYEVALQYLDPDQFAKDKFESLLSFLQQFNHQKPHYSCTQCGYASHGMQWQCPSCNSWSSMRLKVESINE